jgi:hypothetical protein
VRFFGHMPNYIPGCNPSATTRPVSTPFCAPTQRLSRKAVIAAASIPAITLFSCYTVSVSSIRLRNVTVTL